MFKYFKKNEKEPKNLKEVLDYLKNIGKNVEVLKKDLKEFKEENKKTLQKVAVVRFNPFREMGGEQSFSIAVLDANNNGFVVTGLYSQETNRIYAKEIKNGKSTHSLSKEEQEVLNKAMQS